MKPGDGPADPRTWLTAELSRAAGDVKRPYVLLDFPNHDNPGDAAIWLGERRVLEEIFGCGPAYTGSVNCFSIQNLARRVGQGTVFLHGGGNFGDLWERHQRFRERVIGAMPANPIVMLPQTVHFESRAALDRARSVINAHPTITILLRDRVSFEVARREFSARVRLCPDGAVGIGSLDRSRPPAAEVVWLLRRDRESQADVPESMTDDSSVVTDWVRSRATLAERLDRRIRRHRGSGDSRDRLLQRVSGALEDSAARARLRRAVETVCRGRVVITDRLHGHILATLLRIPNVVLDNSYGKNRRFYATWSRDDPLSRFSDDPADALESATELANLADAETSDDSA